jgi:hypothetical protein
MKNLKKLTLSALTTSILLAIQPSANAFNMDYISSIPITVNGFATLAGGWNNSENNLDYMKINPNDGYVAHNFGFQGSIVGLQVAAQLSQKLSFTTQFVGTYGNDDFNAEASWAYLKYEFTPDVALSAGRYRQPMFLYSDTYQVGATYPWVNPPVEIYSLMPWTNLNGAMLNLSHSFKGGWKLSSKTFYGMTKTKADFPLTGNLTATGGIGEQLAITNNIFTLQASVAHVTFSLKNLGPLPQPHPTLVMTNNITGNIYGIGAKLDYKNFLVLSEIGRRDAKGNIGYPAPNDGELPSYMSGYATVGYQFHKWLPTFTFAALKTTNKDQLTHVAIIENTLDASQTSYTAAIKYNISDYMDAKASIERVYTHGTLGFFNGVQKAGAPGPGADKLIPKKPVMIYQLAFDIAF